MYSFLIKWRSVNIVVYGNLIVKCNLKNTFRETAKQALDGKLSKQYFNSPIQGKKIDIINYTCEGIVLS